MARTKSYQHFCPVARSLELVGEKWALLVVRDLLRGPRRFSDLQESLGKVTAKGLTTRLRTLEAAGILERDTEAGRREVWYRLTAKGRELGPVIGALNAWGVRHALRPPLPGERVSPLAVVVSATGFFAAQGVRLPVPRIWAFATPGGPAYAISYNGKRWRWTQEMVGAADVQIEAAPDLLATFYALKGAERRAVLARMDVRGGPEAIEELLIAFDGGRAAPEPAAPSGSR